VRVELENGVPVALAGERLPPLELVRAANRLAGEHGVGRIDIVEDRLLGLKVRENYECPGATLLLTAHRALEALVLTAEELRFKRNVDQKWGEMAYAGLWIDPLKDALEAFIGRTQERVTGVVDIRLYRGSASVVGRSSPWALYSEDLASFDTKTFDQRESIGTVKTHGMQARMWRSIAAERGKL
jgi:argininosuccinate synthase